MSFARTLPLSATNWQAQEFTYINPNKSIFDNLFFTNTAVDAYSHGISAINDIAKVNNSIFILTGPELISDSINVFPSTTEDVLSGSSYSDTSISNNVITTEDIYVQKLIHYCLDDENNSFNVIVIPLDDEEYYKIHPNNSVNSIFLSKKTDFQHYWFEPDTTQTFFVESSSVLSSSFKFAKYGNVQCEADKILLDNKIFWLSGNQCSSVWVENISINNTLTSINLGDILSRGKYQYKRLGIKDNKINRESLVPRLRINNFLKIPNEATINGDLVDDISYNLNDENYIQINWNDTEFTYENELKTNVSFSCMYKPNGTGGNIIGNRSTGKTSGFAFSYNDGLHNFIKTIPFENNVNTYNSLNLKTYEKNFVNANFKLIAYGPDGSGIRWLYDDIQNEIHRLDVDNIALVRISLEKDNKIAHIESDFQNNLWVMNTTRKRFQCYNNNGELIKTLPFSLFGVVKNWDCFYIPILGNTPIPTFGKVTDFDSQGNLYRLVGTNIRKNDVLIHSFKDKVQDFYVDVNDYVWIMYGDNKVAILNSDGKLLKSKQIIKSIEVERNCRISGWSSSGKNTTQILFMDNNLIMEIDFNLEVIHKSSLNLSCKRNYPYTFRGDWTGYKIGKRQNYINHTLYRGFSSPENPFITFDFSYSCVPENSDPVQHGNFREHAPYKPFTKQSAWTGLGFVLDNHLGRFSMYINGTNVLSKTFPSMSRLIRHEFPDNNRYNPILIGAYNGKIGTLSTHTGQDIGNMNAFIGDINIFKTALTNGNMTTIFNDDLFNVTNVNVFKKLHVKIPSKTLHYVDKFHKFMKNDFPGSQSNYFDVNIYGSNLEDSKKSLIEKLMKDKIQKVIPTHVSLRNIVWK